MLFGFITALFSVTWIPRTPTTKGPTTFRNDKKKNHNKLEHKHDAVNPLLDKYDIIDNLVSKNKDPDKYIDYIEGGSDTTPSVYDYIEELDIINEMLQPDENGGFSGAYNPGNNFINGNNVIDEMKNPGNNFINGVNVINEMKNPGNNFISGVNVINEMKNPGNNFINGVNVINEMKNPENNFINGDNVIDEMKNPGGDFIDGDNVIEEMRPDHITGDNVIPEMRPPSTTARPNKPPVYRPTYRPGQIVIMCKLAID